MPDWPVEAIIAAARDVGDRALIAQRQGSYRVWDKSPGHPVCDIDVDVDNRLKTLLAAIDGDAGWLSEETVDDRARLGCRRLWSVDPIDGTRDFIRGRAGWAVSIALIDDGAVACGVLYAPARDELWVAVRGKGVSCNDAPIRAGDRTVLAGARVPAASLPKIDRDLVAVAQPNSIALRMAMVAADQADLVATLRWGYEWDIAAATLIATEASATVTDAFGAPLRFNTPKAQAFGMIAAVPGIHRAAVARLADRAKALIEA